MPDMARTLWVVSRGYPPDEGGVQAYAAGVARAYAELGWTVTVFAKSSAGPRRLDEPGLMLLDVGAGSKPAVYLRLLAAMVAQWRAGGRPAAIHACTWRSALPALPFRARLIVTVHGREIGRPRGFAARLMRFALRRASRIVAVSATTRALLLRRLPQAAGRCVVAFNGVSIAPDGRGLEERSRGPLALLTVCRLVPRKNVTAAVAAVAAARGPLRLRVAGRGPELDRLRRQVAALGAEDRVHLLGFVAADPLRQLYAEADVFLHPQLALEGGDEVEGFGISIADAMAHGLPCIVGRDGGPAELVEDGITGFVVDGRRPDVIAGLVDRLAADPVLRARIGQRARRWAAAHCSWARHAAACLAGLV